MRPVPEEDYRDRTVEYDRIASLFALHGRAMQRVRSLALEVAELTERSGSFIQAHTSIVCPSCGRVCCATRHSYHEVADIICLCALGETLPVYEKDREQGDPCQFMGPEGCTIKRSLRPYRCNWYFCAPLLEHMQGVPARQYRGFTDLMTELGRKREALLQEYEGITGDRAAGNRRNTSCSDRGGGSV